MHGSLLTHHAFTPAEANSHISARNHVLGSLDRSEAGERSRMHYQGPRGKGGEQADPLETNAERAGEDSFPETRANRTREPCPVSSP